MFGIVQINLSEIASLFVSFWNRIPTTFGGALVFTGLGVGANFNFQCELKVIYGRIRVGGGGGGALNFYRSSPSLDVGWMYDLLLYYTKIKGWQ